MKWFRRHRCATPTPEDRTHTRLSVHVGEEARLSMVAVRTSDFSPMGWFEVNVTDAGTDRFDQSFALTLHFPDIPSYIAARDKFNLRERIGGHWADGKDDDGNHPGT